MVLIMFRDNEDDVDGAERLPMNDDVFIPTSLFVNQSYMCD